MKEKNSDNITLKLFNLPIINNVDDLSNHLRISRQLIYQLSVFSDNWYKTYFIEKKSGGKRKIAQPNIILKAIQGWILHEILYKIKSSDYSTAYEINSSTAKHAQIHQGNSNLLIIDLKDFFDTITSKKVYNLFRRVGYNNLISTILTKLCTYEEKLPQGGLCSGKLANLISWSLDSRISGLCAKRGLNFSRYADDLAISGALSKNLKKIIPIIYKIIISEGYSVNVKKTRVLDKSSNRYITGLTLYNDTFGIGTNLKRNIRESIFRFLTKKEVHTEKEANRLNGFFNYLNSVDKVRLSQLIKFATKISKSDNKVIFNIHKISFVKETIKKN